MRRRDITQALLVSTAGSMAFTGKAQAQTCTAPCYALTQAEINAGITTLNANLEYLPGDVRRYGADPLGASDSTAALNRAIATGYSLYFPDGVFLTTGNHAPRSNADWWGTGTLKGSGTANTLVTAGAITNFTFAINTDSSLQTAALKLAISVDGGSNFAIQDGRHVQGGVHIGPTTGCSAFSVRGNIFSATALGNNTSAGAIILNATSHDFELVDNEISAPTGAGIAVFNGAYQGVIAKNVCVGCFGNGIYIDSARYVTVQGNICRSNLQSGIGLNASNPNTFGYPAFCTVTGNVCTGNAYDGIDYNLSVGATSHGTFTTISGNVLSNNGGVNGGTGIYLAYADETTICGNTIVANNQQGVFLNICNYCTVSGNTVVANGTAPNTLDGIAVNGSFNTITGNTSTNNGGSPTQRYGIGEVSGSNYNTIVGNTVNNNVSGPLSIAGGNTVAQANSPVPWDKMFYSSIFSSFTTPATAGTPDGSLWMNPGNGRLYVLQSGVWTMK